MTAITSVRLVRDRATWLIYLQLGVFATYLYGLSAVLPLLRLDLEITQAVAGLHGTAMAAGAVLTGLALPRLTRAIGRPAVAWTGLAGMNAGVLLVLFGGVLPVTLLGYAVAGGMASIMLYSGMAVLSDHHGPAGPAAISEANAVCVTVGIAVPFLVSLAAQSALGWRAALLATPVASALLVLAMGRVRIPGAGRAGTAGAGAVPAGGERSGARDRAEAAGDGAAPAAGERFGARFYLAGAVLFCCVAMEFCFNLWAAKLVSDQTGLSAAVAATALTAFTAGMAAGRWGGAWLALRIAPTPLFVGALALTGAGWAIFWVSGDPVVSYLGLVLSGIGVSLHFPLALSRVLAASGGLLDRASAVASVFSGLAIGAGPFVLGALADGFGAQRAFLMVPVLIGLAVGGILAGGR
ncbi:MFS transporter [Planomonospora parontospora]|uniref:MFS transporter n=1 Tax=Planomonospora parontospora TaxID=58119 RepID=UPI0016713B4B|nr:MFS transporter [Planomonospora parontospora]GGL45786.1 MFS transporter [Planomonospora parontospora subsp. antibiotica]GII18672.1 MFS transporter [Planomonospora parontospora subsp. antibiotica]